ncbi:phosphatidylinositol/phosphatidylcholine transfer protein, putative [Plasmodium berghei]|uniref:Phosphatidylinositol/phosphatidylcholine transfer protein, putative n=2 Tax=Plasmodium berghei TaxID=5821 RepID=A0A509APQ9_PLABA|nr:phosphatidylinositol/phosphatidylcholine transfer protein, putative [Plasmodium berghei ANKA]SCM24004.1 phosphatidylinositol/phosphatidylcholine transfer protein, putative [Plasmodium berghei]SCN26878.1 phosphatidylinositol/phosphatidylcholine transfer protein, putative [Plasmodium berghei]SCO61281.1 phosphatidylinositol/phosphatidylcholine transfer protein, putative [Plasmodium berghei]SCO63299.1 phosphatidylinositol/phosphatidylcholine transfer protein, putative [Plasmodium berghei]VUC567|eukprot:XP_034422494.1 phosphatidylinositol/phosphatidylcholine transfer protein, putative [Plasmodium berghei ANKA]
MSVGQDVQLLKLDTLAKHFEEKINTLKGLLRGKNIKIEDSILIRYILSYGDKTEELVNAVTRAVEWRKENIEPILKNDNLHFKNNNITFPIRVKPYYFLIRKTLAACSHKYTLDNQPVVIGRLKLCNFTFLLDNVPEDIIIDYIVYSNEHEFSICNKQSKKHNYICRTYRFIDLKGFALRKFDKRFLKIFASTSKLSEFLHPQLVFNTYLINAPSYIRITIETLKAFGISRRTLNKLKIPKAIENVESANCEWFNTIVDKKDIPSYLGGLCKCKNGCIPGFKNDQEYMEEFNLEDVKAEIKKKILK